MPANDLAKLLCSGFDVSLNKSIVGRVVYIVRFYLATNITIVVGTIGQRLSAARAFVKYDAG
jgi:hypothetical protein